MKVRYHAEPKYIEPRVETNEDFWKKRVLINSEDKTFILDTRIAELKINF